MPLSPNPILLKELRQSVRSRLIHISIYGLLALLLLLFGNSLLSTQETAIGLKTFSRTATTLVFFLLGIFPYHAFLRLSSEHRKDSLDLLFTTPLSPASIIHGKIQSGLTMALLFTSLAFPFLFLSYHLRGIDLAFILRFLLTLLPSTLCALSFALFMALSATHTLAKRILFAILHFSCSLTIVGIHSSLVADHLYQYWYFPLAVIPFALYGFFLFRALAIYTITPPTTNRAKPLRRTLIALALACLPIGSLASAITHEPAFLAIATFFAILPANLCLLLAITLPSQSTHHTHSNSSFLLSNTSESGILLAILLAASIELIRFLLISCHITSSLSDTPTYGTIPFFLYYASFILAATFLKPRISLFRTPSSTLYTALFTPLVWSIFVSILNIPLHEIDLPGNLIIPLFSNESFLPHTRFATLFFLLTFLPFIPRFSRAYHAFNTH